MANEVANTILKQMGGTGRIMAMTGTKRFTALESGVRFLFPNRNMKKPNLISVVLKGDDTYTVEFWRIPHSQPWKNPAKLLETLESVYAEDLIPLFEGRTGLYLSLGGR